MKKYVLALCLTSTSMAWGACERSDVEFYLSKGFTPDQITSLCRQSDSSVSQPAKKLMSKAEIDDVIERLSQSLRVENLAVEDDVLTFTHTPEIEYEKKAIGSGYREVKPNIDVSIPMITLRVLTSSEGIPMIRSPYIKLGGDVSRSVQNLDGYVKQKRKAIDQYLSEQSDKKIKLKFQLGVVVDETTSDLKKMIDIYN